MAFFVYSHSSEKVGSLSNFMNLEGMDAYRLKTFFLEDRSALLEAQPAHRLAVPLFLLTSIPYLLTLFFDYLGCCQVDTTFAWFGGFYLGLSGIYMLVRIFDKR